MFLLSLQTYATELIKEGAIIKDVYNQLVQKIRDEKPDLEKYFVKTAGFTVCLSSYCVKHDAVTDALVSMYRLVSSSESPPMSLVPNATAPSTQI